VNGSGDIQTFKVLKFYLFGGGVVPERIENSNGNLTYTDVTGMSHRETQCPVVPFISGTNDMSNSRPPTSKNKIFTAFKQFLPVT